MFLLRPENIQYKEDISDAYCPCNRDEASRYVLLKDKTGEFYPVYICFYCFGEVLSFGGADYIHFIKIIDKETYNKYLLLK